MAAIAETDEMSRPSTAREWPRGIELAPLRTNADPRGDFTEIYREIWQLEVRPVQWNLVRSGAGVLRGVHLHLAHDEFYLLAEGEALIGFKDLRRRSPTHGRAAFVRLGGARLELVTIPRGIAHGLFFERPSVLISGVSAFHDPADDLACRWDDPALGMAWPIRAPLLSERDAEAPALAAMLAEIDRVGL